MDRVLENVEKHLHELCFKPSRHVGSEGVLEATEYVAETFKKYGFTAVNKEPFPTVGWHFEYMTFVDLDNGCREVPGAVACFFSQSCNVAGVPVWLNNDNLSTITADEVKGKLCIVDFFSSAADIRGRNGIAEDLDKLGAAGAVFVSDSSYHTSSAASSKIQRSIHLKNLGAAAVAEEGAYYLSTNRDHRYKLIIKAHTFENTSYNVAAIRPGSGSKRAIFGAHHDAAPFGHGATDNASGVACILEMARLLKDELPEWTFEFVSFDAEEYVVEETNCPVGSSAYTAAHSDTKWDFFMNFDSVACAWSEDALFVGRKEKLNAFDTVMSLQPVKLAGDDRSFDRLEVPCLWYGHRSGFKDFHTQLDAICTLDMQKFRKVISDALNVTRTLCK